jgi:signal transduction histidine kinase
VASVLLALIVGAAFVVLLDSVERQRASARLARHSEEVLSTANRLERLLIDLETGQRGFSITGERRFLAPWTASRAALPGVSADLVRLAVGSAQDARARQITAAIESYTRDYSAPLVRDARRGAAAAASLRAADEGKQLVDRIRARFDRFTAAERRLSATGEQRSARDARRAATAAAAGLAGSMLLILFFGGYLTRAIILPIRRAAAMAGRLAHGELSTRVPETGAGEIRELGRAFNAMGRSLEANRDELRLLAEQQAALRRVATLVARGVPSEELLDAVVGEVDLVLGASSTRLARYEADDTVVVVVSSDRDGGLPVGARWQTDGDHLAGQVHRTGRTARRDSVQGVTGELAEQLREMGVRSAVAAPIIVNGQLWGTMVSYWTDHDPPRDVEQQLPQFTDLVATAIANADSRAALTASRARVVATADETRRRIERDLHDGAQQRLVHAVITLKLARRALQKRDETVPELVDEALEHAERATAALRELVHGILPAALSRGGLDAGVRALVARAPLGVSVEVTSERLPRLLEATAYFIIAEALTNVVKHAGASSAEVRAFVDGDALHVEVRDEGVGGARLDGSSGLLALHDRAAAVDGALTVESPVGEGTVVAAVLPVAGAQP